MSPKSTSEIRQAFLDYFKQQEHTIVPSSPLVPANDPTLLFTNAGMVQFKEVFLGVENRPYKRAASCQGCVRAGGKHNDLENVGYTARHHTFFEMLGNFSFGDYFKREAIRFAWEFLTGVLAIPPEKLWVTVYRDDDEAADIWLKEMGVDPQRFSRCDEKDNFWTMGPTGPCGPCSEIFYDHGPGILGGPPGSPDADGDRYVEIWNLVFTQYDRGEDGKLHPIPHPGVDTGMGLERISAVMQGVHSNYDIDVFRTLTGAVAAMTANPAGADRAALQVIADHIRSCGFIAAEGVVPSNEGRGYVLRRIVRRAVRYGNKLGIRGLFFHRLVEVLAREMGAAYPLLVEQRAQVERVLKQEEERFAETLEQGLKLLDRVVSDLRGKVIPGKDIFQLYDTYGFPMDLTQDVARERGLTLDMTGFEREMEAQRERAREASRFVAEGSGEAIPADRLAPFARDFEFTGYGQVADRAEVRALFSGSAPVQELSAGMAGVVVLNHTPFYADSGGQVGDKGKLRGADGIFEVTDTRKQGGVHLHYGVLKMGHLRVGDKVEALVDDELRQPTRLNHSATHLLHAALRKVLGGHVTQKGSLVAPNRLRFDFSHGEPVSAEQMREIERLVNDEIRANREIVTRVMSLEKAIDSGAMALFGEKYDADVRVLSMGDFSVELCGGTHARRTGDIGLFKIIAETGVAAGVRRIEAVTGQGALEWVESTEHCLRQLNELVKGSRDTLVDKVSQLTQRLRQQDKEIQALRGKLSSQKGTDLGAGAVEIGGVKVVAESIEGADAAALRDAVDQLKNKLQSAALVLASAEDGKVLLVAGVTKDVTAKVRAGDLVNFVAQQVGGKGGGRPDLAQAGGTDPSKLDEALRSVPEWVRERLAG